MPRPNGSFYTFDGERYDRVSNGPDIIAKPQLYGWYAGEAAKRAVEERATWERMPDAEAIAYIKAAAMERKTKAAALGTEVHAAAEAVEMGMPEDMWPAHLGKHGLQYARYLREWKPRVVVTEAQVINHSHRYAGTLDTICEFSEKLGPGLFIVDKKTGRGIYPEHDLQQAAYRFAEELVMGDGSRVPMPEVRGVLILHLTEKDYELIPVDADEDSFAHFIRALYLYRWKQRAHSKIGKPLRPNDSAVGVVA